MEDKRKQIRVGAILGYLNYAVRMLIQLVYIPIMLRLMGQEEYGVYQLVSSLISYLSLLNFGFGGAYLRFYSQCKGNKEKEAELNGTYMNIFLVFALLALMVGGMLTYNSDIILGNKLSISELELAKKLFFILTINMGLTFPLSVFSSIISARECFIFQRVVELLKTISNPFLVIMLLMMGYGSIGMVLVSTAITILGGIVDVLFVARGLRVTFNFRKFNRKLVKEIGSFSFFLFLNSIIDQINWNVDKYLLGRIIGSSAIAIYSVGAQINNIYIQITDMLATVLAPKINNIVANNDKPMELLNYLFVKVGRLQAFIVLAVSCGFTIFGKEFIELWAGKEYTEAYYITLLLIIPVSVPLCQTLGVDIQRALNRHQYRSILYGCIALLNILISIPLIRYFGVLGSALGTGISILLGNGLMMNIIYEKVIGLNVKYFWIQILKIIPAIIIPCIIALGIKTIFLPDSWFAFLIEVIVFICLYVVCLYMGVMNKEEKREIKMIIKKD